MRRLTDAQRDEAARLYPLAREMSRPYWERRPWLADEIESGAGLAAIEAARSPDPDAALASRVRLKARDAAYRTRPSFRRQPTSPATGLDLSGVPAPPPAADLPSPILDVVSALPPRCWQALDLSVIRGLGRSATARIMGIDRKNVRKHLAVAMGRLRTVGADMCSPS